MNGNRRTVRVTMLGVLLAGVVTVLPAAQPASARPSPRQTLYVPPPDPGAKRQIAKLTSQHHRDDADLIRSMIETPQAVWFTKGTPRTVRHDVHSTVVRAAA